MKQAAWFIVLGLLVTLLGTACGGAAPPAAPTSAPAAPTTAAAKPATSGVAASGPALDAIKQKKELVVGVEAAFEPFETLNNGQFEGFDIDLSNLVAEPLGAKATFIDTEYPGLIPGLQQGKFDVVISAIVITEERSKQVEFSQPYAESTQKLVVRYDDEQIKSNDDLRGKTVAVSNPAQFDAFALHAVLRANGVQPDEVNLLSAQDAGSRFTALTSGALPAAILPLPFDQQAEQLGFRELAWTADYFHRAQSGLIATPSHLQQRPDQVRRMIRATLRSIRYALDHEAETVAYVTQDFDVNPGLAQSTYAKIARGLSANGDIDPTGLQEEIDEDLARIGREDRMRASEVMDLTLLRAVQRELGTR
jgi:ABC-type amino acid transport substrate-binding protein